MIGMDISTECGLFIIEIYYLAVHDHLWFVLSPGYVSKLILAMYFWICIYRFVGVNTLLYSLFVV